jgi:hypothetical protein
MSSHLELVHKHTNGSRIRAEGEGIRIALAVTDDGVIAARSGFLGRWGSKVECFELRHLVALRTVPNPSANLMILEFEGTPRRTLTVMYGPQAQADFKRIVGLLEARVGAQQGGGK